jgi:putative component of toxin-antitoxin plasmid stabilization module
MSSQRRIICQGRTLTLYAVAPKGVCEVYDWLTGLDDAAQTAFLSRFEHLCEVGRLRSPGHWRQLDAGVFEIKVHCGPGYRLYMLRDGNNFIATRGCKKPKDGKVGAEVRRARGIFSTYRGGEV